MSFLPLHTHNVSDSTTSSDTIPFHGLGGGFGPDVSSPSPPGARRPVAYADFVNIKLSSPHGPCQLREAHDFERLVGLDGGQIRNVASGSPTIQFFGLPSTSAHLNPFLRDAGGSSGQLSDVERVLLDDIEFLPTLSRFSDNKVNNRHNGRPTRISAPTVSDDELIMIDTPKGILSACLCSSQTFAFLTYALLKFVVMAIATNSTHSQPVR